MNDNNVDAIARLCHEANRAYCRCLGDNSHVSWDDTSDNIKNSTRSGVRFALANPDITPEQSHANWLRDKAADGFVYGERKDNNAKTHPCFVPYEKLPVEQREKDRLFLNLVAVMSAYLHD